ncbi:hypothetical protein BDW22DRAFT_1361129 [Trametopsis cervina]|nr:hypothetical protein BDW22DRAFT_1361129 [Trametopsis cervina]
MKKILQIAVLGSTKCRGKGICRDMALPSIQIPRRWHILRLQPPTGPAAVSECSYMGRSCCSTGIATTAPSCT